MKTPSLSDIELARFNMIEQQIRPWDVGDDALLKAIAEVPREQFVPAEHQSLAFSDLEIPLVVHGIDTHQVMLAPKSKPAWHKRSRSSQPTVCWKSALVRAIKLHS